MLPSRANPKVLVIVGPTAVGKTEFSIRLAEQINGELISMDSRLLYRGMDIGTAKPSQEEQNRIAHHMIDLAEPDDTWSLALFRTRVIGTIDDVIRRGKRPILVGGTGQYVRALMEGWVIPAQQPDLQLRGILEAWGKEIGSVQLHQKLGLLDPQAAMVIEPNNLRRVVRALEVIFKTGLRFSDQREKDAPPFDFWVIGLTRPREELYRRIDKRIENMFASGLVEEVKELLAKGYQSGLPALSAIGYREVCQVLSGEITIDDAKRMMKKETREFVRRQANWFKKDDPNIHWYEMEPDPLQVVVNDLRIGNFY